MKSLCFVCCFLKSFLVWNLFFSFLFYFSVNRKILSASVSPPFPASDLTERSYITGLSADETNVGSHNLCGSFCHLDFFFFPFLSCFLKTAAWNQQNPHHEWSLPDRLRSPIRVNNYKYSAHLEHWGSSVTVWLTVHHSTSIFVDAEVTENIGFVVLDDYFTMSFWLSLQIFCLWQWWDYRRDAHGALWDTVCFWEGAFVSLLSD